MDYLLPTAWETPEFELGETVTPSPHHPIGAKGVGESATVGSPAAYVNAVIDALGARGRAGTSRCRVTLGPRSGRRWWRPGWPSERTGRAGRGGPAHRGRASRSCSRRSSGSSGPRRRKPGDRGARHSGRDAHRLGRRRLLRADRDPRGAACARRRRAPAAAHRAARAAAAEVPDDVVVAESMCASEGTVEVLIEPQLPRPLARRRRRQPGSGDPRRARRRRSAGGSRRKRADRRMRSSWRPWATATRRRWPPPSAAGTGYIGLVASARRAATVLAALRERGLGEEDVAASAARPAWTSGRAASRRSPSQSSPSSSPGATPGRSRRRSSSRRSIPSAA